MEAEVEIASEPAKAVFDHKNNITVGRARVIFAKACTPIGRNPLPDGYALPGGHRTTDRNEALEVAVAMNSLMLRK